MAKVPAGWMATHSMYMYLSPFNRLAGPGLSSKDGPASAKMGEG